MSFNASKMLSNMALKISKVVARGCIESTQSREGRMILVASKSTDIALMWAF